MKFLLYSQLPIAIIDSLWIGTISAGYMMDKVSVWLFPVAVIMVITIGVYYVNVVKYREQ